MNLKVFFILVLFTGSLSLEAKRVVGYIVTNQSDTIHGTVNLILPFDQTTANIIIREYNSDDLHLRIRFRQVGTPRFKWYYPEQIKGFGFKYQGVSYYYRSFAIYQQSLVKAERKRKRFLCLQYSGSVDLYKDLIIQGAVTASTPLYTRSPYSTTYDYYLYSSRMGLIRAVKCKDTKTVKDLLRQFGFMEAFLEQVPDNATFKNIKEYLKAYDLWVARNFPGKVT
jgi:hypothetical protein